ncbi:ribokinase-like isoform X2 [Prorops nasuta]|uniref:ribokinase-like isoform X2 n=1 Tax=Prorops nasuta TaxID=863751 RepID=UPI0034CFA106
MAENIVVVGSCMIDFTCYSPRLPKPGETVIGSKFEQNYGGKGANQCVMAARLGASTTLVASLGADSFGFEYLKILKEEKINVSYIQLQNNKHSGVAHITVAENGENSICIVLGANELLSPKVVDSSIDVIKNASILLLQFEIPLETTLHALRVHKGHVNGAPSIKNVNTEILSLCDIFCVNETEAEIMTDIESLSSENIQEAINKLLLLGCNTVIITLGALGAVYASQSQKTITRITTSSVEPVDTTGAGDAFLGAFAYFKASHPMLSMDECIRRACYVATESVLKYGTHGSYPKKSLLPVELFQ